MGKLRARYNEKARSFGRSATQQLHPNARDGGIKALKRKYDALQQPDQAQQGDERSVHIRKVLNIPTDQKLSSTRKKRLEKFIDKQLKKEQRVDLIQKLGCSSVDPSLLVKSSSGISQGHQGISEKDRVNLEYLQMKAGLPLPKDSVLFVNKTKQDETIQVTINPELKNKFGSALKQAQAVSNRPVMIIPEANSSSEDESEDEGMVQEVGVIIGQSAKTDQSLPVQNDTQNHVSVEKKPSRYVLIDRLDKVQEGRLQLPILAEEHAIMEHILSEDVLVLSGETGSGKSSQLPQFLYEAGFGNGEIDDERGGLIAVTQPRRVAAVSIAQRVGYELKMPHIVSYQVRYDSNVSDQTKIKFMTDGILLKEISSDLLLLKYSCIIIDEAHERSLNTDILIGFLSRIVTLRRQMHSDGKGIDQPDGLSRKVWPLKLIIMSATLRTNDFTDNQRLFKVPPPLFKVEARQFPVSIHFNKETPVDFVSAAFDKVVKIHKQLPPGAVLVFLNGRQEIMKLVGLLQEKFCGATKQLLSDDNMFDASDDYSDEEYADEKLPFDEQISLTLSQSQSVKVLPLYAMQPTTDQMKVFEPLQENQRLVVVATNVAETSLTIPGVKYIVDSGKVKQREYDIESQVSTFRTSWTSKASANQRAGRAGRCEPGHVYRLYSSAVYQHEFEEFSKPEIQRMSIEGVVLLMKSMSIDNVVRFPFPTQPDTYSLVQSENLLVTLGALDQKYKRITDDGKVMSLFPLAPRLSRLLFSSICKPDIIAYVVQMVSLITAGDPFQSEKFNDSLGSVGRAMRSFSIGLQSDMMTFIRIMNGVNGSQNLQRYCKDSFLNYKVVKEAQQLQSQLLRILSTECGVIVQSSPQEEPTAKQFDCIRQVIICGYKDHIAEQQQKLFAGQRQTPYKVVSSTAICDKSQQAYVYLHPGSSLAHQEPPKYVVYQNLRTASESSHTELKEELEKRVYMTGLTALFSLEDVNIN